MSSSQESRSLQLGLPPGLTAPQLVEHYGSHYADSFAAIPPGVFTPGFRETICTVSGNTLTCKVDDGYVHIYDSSNASDDDLADPTFRFTAGVSNFPEYADHAL